MSGRAAATSYDESVGSCGPPTSTPSTPPATATPRGAPVRRQLDFTGGGDLKDEEEEEEEVLCRVADDIERGYSEAKRRAPPCVCGRGLCAMERDEQRRQWKYVCPSRPKCNHIAFCEEVYLNPKSEPTTWNHPKPSNHMPFNDPSNHMSGPRAGICPEVTGTATPGSNRPQVVGATTPFSDSPQVVGATNPFSDSPQVVGASTPFSDSPHVTGTATPGSARPQVVGAATPFSDSPQGAKFLMPSTPAKFIRQGAVAAALPKVSPQGVKSNEVPVCQCTAGKCKKLQLGKEDWYVCPITKGNGACSYKVLVSDFVKDIVPSAQATTLNDEVHPESPNMVHQPIADIVNTPSETPTRYYGTPSPISPNSTDTCYQCHEKGHWRKDCPKQSPRDKACFKCGVVGHWKQNCPQL